MVYGVTKDRRILILLFALFLGWQTLLPESVVDRINMTTTEEGELESSASKRLDLWDKALNIYDQNPVIGVGYDGFRITLTREGSELTDVHNYFLKLMCEQGLIGLFFFLLIISRAFLSGRKLYRIARTQFHQGLGFGFMGAILSLVVANFFGDRFSYFPLGGYFWIFWGIVDRAILINQRELNLEQSS